MSHAPHADVHEAGLADGCPACEEAAERPTATLDHRMLADLIQRTLDDRFNAGEPARSRAEAVAMANVMNTLERAGKLFEVAPAHVAWYLRERWHVDLAAAAEEAGRL